MVDASRQKKILIKTILPIFMSFVMSGAFNGLLHFKLVKKNTINSFSSSTDMVDLNNSIDILDYMVNSNNSLTTAVNNMGFQSLVINDLFSLVNDNINLSSTTSLFYDKDRLEISLPQFTVSFYKYETKEIFKLTQNDSTFLYTYFEDSHDENVVLTYPDSSFCLEENQIKVNCPTSSEGYYVPKESHLLLMTQLLENCLQNKTFDDTYYGVKDLLGYDISNEALEKDISQYVTLKYTGSYDSKKVESVVSALNPGNEEIRSLLAPIMATSLEQSLNCKPIHYRSRYSLENHVTIADSTDEWISFTNFSVKNSDYGTDTLDFYSYNGNKYRLSYYTAYKNNEVSHLLSFAISGEDNLLVDYNPKDCSVIFRTFNENDMQVSSIMLDKADSHAFVKQMIDNFETQTSIPEVVTQLLTYKDNCEKTESQSDTFAVYVKQ